MSQFWDTYTPDCQDCKSYEREAQRKDKRIAELERQLAETKEDTRLLNDLIDVSNDGHDLLAENVWDCLPGNSEDMHQEVRSALRSLIDTARKEAR